MSMRSLPLAHLTPDKLKIVACPGCDALQTANSFEFGTFRCRRCGAVVHRRTRNPLQRALALYLASAVAFALCNLFPIMSIEVGGTKAYATLVGAAAELA